MSRFWGWVVVLLTVSLLLVSFDSRAQRLDPKQAPEPLRPWTSWVLSSKPEALCPFMQGSAESVHCFWPTALSLSLGEKGGHFEQRWHLDARAWVPLPGDLVRWPLDVTEGGKRLVVVEHASLPSVELESGEHTIVGAFAWDSMPDSLQVPPATGIVSLQLEGSRVAEPRRDEEGRVFLQKTSVESEGERLEIVVQRKVTDDVPLSLTTRVVLNVAGKSRELVLGKALPPGFTPMSISSELPARIEPDTRLRVQARPGTWTIEITARSEGPVSELARPVPDGPWREGEEVWVFEAKSALRLTSVEGVRAIDPQQTLLADDWKALPTYAVALGDKMQLVEKRRGDVEPEPDRLSLSRSLWLDFDGGGYTVNDTITGTVHRATRLEMLPPTVLGRVAVDGKDQFITHLDKDPNKAGVELRQGPLTVSADSRINADARELPAVGWDHDFHEVSATLHVPPGFRLFHASGADEVPGTWIRHWTLLELFLVLVLSLSFAKLFGRGWGALACLTFTLVFPETDAARWLWAAALVTEALSRVIPAGKARVACSVLRLGALLILLLSTLPFVVQHIREGIYPALAEGEGNYEAATSGGFLERKMEESAVAPAPPPMPAPEQKVPAAAPVELAPEKPTDDRRTKHPDLDVLKMQPLGALSSQGPGSGSPEYRQFNEAYDPNAMVQTGPGLPKWSWSTTNVTFSGPVERSQRLHFYFLSPPINLLLALLRAALLVLLFARLLPFGTARLPGFGRPAAALASLALVFLMAPTARADIPNDALLDQYRERLLEKPDCSPTCASSSRMLLEVQNNVLRVRLAIEASATTAVPLPGGAAQWLPERVLLDGNPAQGLLRSDDGALWLRLSPGAHDVIVEGALPARESLQIALPLKPHHVRANVDGWLLEGVHEDGLADEHLQLTRVAKEDGGKGAALAAGALPPFVRVERTLMIGLNWQVHTRIERVTPTGSAVVLEVPLLRGESVTTPDVRVTQGRVLVNMAPDASAVEFRSVLEERSPLNLVAPKSVGWSEVWRLDLSPIWHATLSGVPVVHSEASVRVPEWRPWPGETVTIQLLKPAGITGQTLTIDNSTYDVRPGLRATDATVSFSLRSSRGGEHVMHLPEGAQLESVKFNGAPQPLRQQGRKVTLAIVPGQQTVELAFRLPQGITAWFKAPPFDFGTKTVNATTSIRASDARWVLFVHGPRLGPAVLFWSLLLVLVVIAFALGKITWVPLKRHEWMLLAIGLSQIPLPAAALVIGWLVALGFRRARPAQRAVFFDLGQLVLVGWTFIALGILVYAVQQGLMGTPEMQIQGNGSSSELLQWFDDRTGPIPEQPAVLSVPMLAYRGVMLAWALWLALSLLRWLRWGWLSFSDGGFWKRAPKRAPPIPPSVPQSVLSQPADVIRPATEPSTTPEGVPPI
ncbi:MAG TPA: hypothetical protein VER96_13190 [Polyangiaceae bacterium]|nr:hypothetical protein [Polyangiaceae bacterium]